jgi:MtN3 and saliva related transmembrane protein
MIEILGFAAAIFTTTAFVPQAYRVYKTKKTGDLSLSMFAMFSIGVFLWLIYGIAISSVPVICANVVTLILALYILVIKVTGDKKAA